MLAPGDLLVDGGNAHYRDSTLGCPGASGGWSRVMRCGGPVGQVVGRLGIDTPAVQPPRSAGSYENRGLSPVTGPLLPLLLPPVVPWRHHGRNQQGLGKTYCCRRRRVKIAPKANRPERRIRPHWDRVGMLCGAGTTKVRS